MEQITTVKLVFIAVIGLSSFFVGISPMVFAVFRRSELLASLSNCYAGGLFLAVGLIHLLPEGSELLEGQVGEMPLGHILAICGYSLILFIDKVLLSHSHGPVPRDDSEEMVRNAVSTKAQVSMRLESGGLHEIDLDGHSELGEQIGVTAAVLGIALSVHSVFEGIAIGLQGTLSDVFNVGMAVFLHKWAAALALGINLKSVEKAQGVLMISIFSVATPIGVLVGIAMAGGEQGIVEGVFLGLCCGTFLYIGCSEVIVEEFSSGKNRWLKYFAFLVGFISFTLLNHYITD